VDYASYKQFWSELLREKRVLRLDCMNPVRALSSLAFDMPRTEPEVSASIEEVVFAWSRATGIELYPQRTVVGCGVRVLLSAVFSSVLSSGQELWLPEDVYPVYRELAENLDVILRSFQTLPRPNLEFLAETGQRAAVVLPVPISPLGRLPTDAETGDLRRWLLYLECCKEHFPVNGSDLDRLCVHLTQIGRRRKRDISRYYMPHSHNCLTSMKSSRYLPASSVRRTRICRS
jgi:hypothetical protein